MREVGTELWKGKTGVGTAVEEINGSRGMVWRKEQQK